jgi:hypothetical protein
MDITITSSKRHPIRMPEERNQPLAGGFYLLLFGILRIQAKAKHVLNCPGDLSFISFEGALV